MSSTPPAPAHDDARGTVPPPAPTRADRLRGLWNLVNLSTVLGLIAAVVLRCRLEPGPHGLLRAHDWPLRFPGGAAFTVGEVVFTRPGVRMSEALWRHESMHSRQYAACLGLPFLPLYGLAVAWSTLRTGDPASRNPFERGAGLQAGGYRERPVRWPAPRTTAPPRPRA